MRNFIKPTITLSVLALALTACGGSDDTLSETGGGDGGQSGGGSGGQQSDQVTITRNNAEDIASSAIGVREISELSDELLEITKLNTASINNKPNTFKSKTFSSKLQNNFAAMPDTISQDCNSGSFDITLDISKNANNLPEFQAGNSISIVFNQCSFGQGESMNGGMSLSISALEGDFPNGDTMNVSMTMEFEQLTTIEDGDSVVANGDLSTTIETTPLMASVSIASTLFEISIDDEKESISNLMLKETLDLTNNSMSFNGKGTLTSNQMGGTYSFETPTPMLTLSKDIFPSSGVIKVTGNQSSLTLKAVNETDVEIDLDLDGDGETDDTINTTWEKLIDDL